MNRFFIATILLLGVQTTSAEVFRAPSRYMVIHRSPCIGTHRLKGFDLRAKMDPNAVMLDFTTSHEGGTHPHKTWRTIKHIPVSQMNFQSENRIVFFNTPGDTAKACGVVETHGMGIFTNHSVVLDPNACQLRTFIVSAEQDGWFDSKYTCKVWEVRLYY